MNDRQVLGDGFEEISASPGAGGRQRGEGVDCAVARAQGVRWRCVRLVSGLNLNFGPSFQASKVALRGHDSFEA